MKMCHRVVCGVSSIPMGLGKHERAVTHARIRITDIMGGAMDMSFGKKEFAAGPYLPSYCHVPKPVSFGMWQ